MDEVGTTEYERIMDVVMAEVLKNPKANNEDLRKRAAAVSASVNALGIRQFQGKYRLPAIRRLRKEGKLPPAPPRPVRNGRRKRAGAQQAPTPLPAARTASASFFMPTPLSASTREPAPAPAPPAGSRPSGRKPRGGASAPRAVAPAARSVTDPTPPKSGFNRDVARRELMKFAVEISGADDQKDTLAVVATIDDYVDRIAKASQ